MCRLFGLVSDHPVRVIFSMLRSDNAFRKQSLKHSDGWGIGYYENDAAKVSKQALSAYESTEFENISRSIRSSRFVAHVRKKSSGGINLANTHPFEFNNWILAQNGGVGGKWHNRIREEVGKGKIKGSTSGEHLLVWLYTRAGNLQGENQIEAILNSLKRLTKTPETFTSANLVMTTGDNLYAFRYAPTGQSGRNLYYLERMKSDTIQSGETGFSAELINPPLSIGKKVFLVASERITNNETWQPVKNGELLIVNNDVSMEKVSIL